MQNAKRAERARTPRIRSHRHAARVSARHLQRDRRPLTPTPHTSPPGSEPTARRFDGSLRLLDRRLVAVVGTRQLWLGEGAVAAAQHESQGLEQIKN